jgi:hypothetical protein
LATRPPFIPAYGAGEIATPVQPTARRRAVTPPSKPIDSPGVGDTPGPGSPILPRAVPQQQGPNRTDVFIPATEPLAHIMGAVAGFAGAQLWHESVLPNGDKLVLWAICHGERQYVNNIQVDDKPIATYGLTLASRYNVYVGNSSQTVDPIGAAAYSTRWTKRFPYVAYIVAQFPAPNANGQPAPDVRRMRCDVGPMLIPDPRLDASLVTLYASSNPDLNLAYWMNSPIRTTEDGTKYSFGPAYVAPVDWSASVTTSANASDVNIGGGTKRFSIGLVMNEAREPEEWIEVIRAHAQIMKPVYNNGKWQIVKDLAQSPSGITLTDQGSGANIIDAGPLEVASSAQVYTRVVVNYTNDAAGSKPSDPPAIDDDPGIATGAVEINEKVYDLWGIRSYDQAKRIAKYLRKRSAMDKASWIRVNSEGIQLLPGILILVTSLQLNWASQACIITDLRTSSNAQTPSAWDVRVELYDAAVYDDTKQTASAFAPPAIPSPYDVPGEILNPVAVGSAFDKSLAIYWSAPRAVISTLYGASNWTQSNCGNWDATKVNDGVTTLRAFDLNVAADSTVTLDFGAGNSKQLISLLMLGSNSFGGVVEYSDNLSSWTAVTIAGGPPWSMPGAPTTYFGAAFEWLPPGAHRAWRWRKNESVARAIDVYEMQWGEAGAINPFIREYQIYDTASGGKKLFKTVPAAFAPTVTAPLAIGDLVHDTRNIDGTGSVTVNVTIVAVSIGRVPSAGRTYAPFLFWAPAAGYGIGTTNDGATVLTISGGISSRFTTIALSTGNNNNLASGLYSNILLTAGVGQAGPFTVTGVASSSDGKEFTLVNLTGQTITFTHEDTSSSAASRVWAVGSAAFTIAHLGSVTLKHEPTNNRKFVTAKVT